MSHAIVTAALRGVNNPIESITNYLNEKFAVGAYLTIPNLEICIPLAVTAFAFFTIG